MQGPAHAEVHPGQQGRSLFKAVDHLRPAATGAGRLGTPRAEFYRYAASDVVHAAADVGDRQAKAVVPRLEAPPAGDLRALRPAAERLDSIAG